MCLGSVLLTAPLVGSWPELQESDPPGSQRGGDLSIQPREVRRNLLGEHCLAPLWRPCCLHTSEGQPLSWLFRRTGKRTKIVMIAQRLIIWTWLTMLDLE